MWYTCTGGGGAGQQGWCRGGAGPPCGTAAEVDWEVQGAWKREAEEVNAGAREGPRGKEYMERRAVRGKGAGYMEGVSAERPGKESVHERVPPPRPLPSSLSPPHLESHRLQGVGA